MPELKNYAEIKFTNAVLIGIFNNYAENSDMAEFVSADGSIDLKFKVNLPVEPPASCEQVLSLMFALFESNPDTTIGRIYMANQREILRETMYQLAMVLDSFSDVKLTLHTAVPDKNDPDKAIESHTEFTLTRTRSTKTENL